MLGARRGEGKASSLFGITGVLQGLELIINLIIFKSLLIL